jgi:hypothetical protein
MKHYKPLSTFKVLGDNLYFCQKSKEVTLYKGEMFSVWNKQKDLFDADIEYWATFDGWLLKINRADLANLEEVDTI